MWSVRWVRWDGVEQVGGRGNEVWRGRVRSGVKEGWEEGEVRRDGVEMRVSWDGMGMMVMVKVSDG